MKLKELLKVIPDNYLLGLRNADEDNYSILVFGNKKDIIFGYGQRARWLPEQVTNLNVIALHPGVSAELHVKPPLLIEVSSEEGERK